MVTYIPTNLGPVPLKTLSSILQIIFMNMDTSFCCALLCCGLLALHFSQVIVVLDTINCASINEDELN